MFTLLLLGQDFFTTLFNVPLMKVLGASTFFATTIFPLINLIFEIDGLPHKIYEECIAIMEKALK
ncbi:hypothetical protein [Chroococcus sp. FPU101]|uniref:hypothetical protein n=1 Tax=Chroococcus sp. FPU101 TaxID=1974212 RepID=UPI001A8F7EA5|nr:hypothetical protein [Chroococcus sp. FPU101]